MSNRIDHGLVALVKSKTAITNVIGSNPMRFYPVKLRQNQVVPAVAYRIFNNEDRATFDGASTYDFAYIDLQCYGKSYADVNNLWGVLRSQLESASGTFNSVVIDHVWYMDSGMEGYIDELELETKQLELKIGYIRTN